MSKLGEMTVQPVRRMVLRGPLSRHDRVDGSATLSSGDTVLFKNTDTWTGTPPLFTATAGVTYDGKTYGTGTKAILRATADANQVYEYGIFDVCSSGVTVQGFKVDGNSHVTTGINVCRAASVNFSNVIIDDCEIYNIGGYRNIYVGSGVQNVAISYITVTNIVMHDGKDTQTAGVAVYPGWAQTGSSVNHVTIRGCTATGLPDAGLYIKDNAQNVTAEFNTFTGGGKDGVIISEVADTNIGYPQNIVIRYNVISNNYDWGIMLSNYGRPKTVDIYGNLIFNNGRLGAGFGGDLTLGIGSTGNYGGSVISIYDNTFYSAANTSEYPRSVVMGDGEDGGPGITNGTITFKNNIISANILPFHDYANIIGTNHSNNLYYRSSGTLAFVGVRVTHLQILFPVGSLVPK